MSGLVNFNVTQHTHPGLQRENNQDDMAWFSLPGVELFIVVDGMGGAVGGKMAASMAVKAIHEAFANFAGTISERLAFALNEANGQIHSKSRSDDKRYQGMGTTAVALALVPEGRAHVAHVGDSRIYLHRKGRLRQITQDQTVLQRRIDNGLISPEEAKNATDGHILCWALGPKKETRPEVGPAPVHLQPDDLILMCTDGLSDAVPDEQIRRIMDKIEPIDQIGGDLIESALEAGGPDNITVQIISFAGAQYLNQEHLVLRQKKKRIDQ